MGLFDKLFGKKKTVVPAKETEIEETETLQPGDTIIATGEHTVIKVVHPLTDEQKDKISKSTILLRTGQLYMHYWTNNLVCTDRNDPAWQNKVMFFWKANEPFPKKSLPPEFRTYQSKYFLFKGSTDEISLHAGKAMPWFGMPGLGEKYFCVTHDEKITIPEMYDMGFIEYVEKIELTNNNLDILDKKDEYYFLVDDNITPFQDGNFYLAGKPVSIALAYSVGGLQVIRETVLNK